LLIDINDETMAQQYQQTIALTSCHLSFFALSSARFLSASAVAASIAVTRAVISSAISFKISMALAIVAADTSSSACHQRD
jgi:hypothetical protein